MALGIKNKKKRLLKAGIILLKVSRKSTNSADKMFFGFIPNNLDAVATLLHSMVNYSSEKREVFVIVINLESTELEAGKKGIWAKRRNHSYFPNLGSLLNFIGFTST